MRKVPLPDGAKLYLATALGSALAFGTASNAANAVVTVENSLKANDLVILDSEDWPELTGLVACVKTATAQAVTLDGVDTSNTVKFPAGGKLSLIPLPDDAGFQRLPYVPTFALSGGELQTGNTSYLDVEESSEFKTGRSARRLQYTISWKGDGVARAALKAANGQDPSVHKLVYRDGSASYYVGELDYDDAASTEKGQEQVTTSTVLLRHAPTYIGSEA